MLDLKNKTFFITGVANKKSVACFIAKSLISEGAKCIFSAQNETNLAKVKKLFPDSPCFILDVENESDKNSLLQNIKEHTQSLDGFIHSMAFANFNPETPKFHQTLKKDFLQACHISCFSLIEITNILLPILDSNASIVTIGISNTKATSYGYLGPIKAMLETSVCFLAKSLSENTKIRVNCIGSGPLKTSASAGIPNYIENFIYSEALTMRKETLNTQEVANTALFLLSDISSGINAETIVIDAGMNSNYFDQNIVTNFAKDF